MSKYKYQSGFSPYFEGFVKAKEIVNLGTIQYTKVFDEFDRFVVSQGYSGCALTEELVSKWRSTRVNDSNKTLYGKMLVLVAFGKYLVHNGVPSFIPRVPNIKFDYDTPYIYSKEEMSRIFESADSLRVNDLYHYDVLHAIPSLLRVLYVTGMRIGETLAIKNKDVNFEKRIIVVEDTKNKMHKLMPINESLNKVLLQYYEFKCNLKLPDCDVESPEITFFCSLHGKKLQEATIHRWFKRILSMSGIPYIGGCKGPHIHHIRHTFAVHSLHKLVTSGEDIYSVMPVLSKFLGHKDLRGTERYVRLTHEIYPEINDIMSALTADIYPKPKDNNHENVF